jgi:hypothetical protein
VHLDALDLDVAVLACTKKHIVELLPAAANESAR